MNKSTIGALRKVCRLYRFDKYRELSYSEKEKKRGGYVILKTLKKLLIAAAFFCLACSMNVVHAQAAQTNVVKSAKQVKGGKWVSSKNGRRYRYQNRKYAKNVWIKSGSYVYRMDSQGYAQTGWFTYKGVKYYADQNGRLYVKKWLNKNGNRYYFQSNGVYAKSKWEKIGGKYYYFLKDGQMARNRMITTSKKTYYVNASGVRVKSTWLKKSGKKYYFMANGVRAEKKWVKSGGKYYYLMSNGQMAVDRWVGSYYVGENGARLTDRVVDGYYLNSSGKKTVKVFKGDYIFLGDSRMVGMKRTYSPSNTLYIAKEGMGYSWLKSTGGPTLKNYLKANPNVKVVLALGVNDLGNIQSYISYYRSLIKAFPKTKFYVLSVNPVDQKKEARYGYSIKNSSITSFNKKLYVAFRSSFINSYNYMKKNGFETRDGLHYTAEVYKDLYDYIIRKIK